MHPVEITIDNKKSILKTYNIYVYTNYRYKFRENWLLFVTVRYFQVKMRK